MQIDAQIVGLHPSSCITDRYEIIGCLGAGRMGVVYHCKDKVLADFEVALKLLNPPGSGRYFKQYSMERFLNEIKTTYRVLHPNVVRTYDAILEPDQMAYTMEYVRGGDLADLLQDGICSMAESVSLLKQICSGLGAIHRAGIIHRDLKPANILLTPERQPKIADFSVARAADSPRLTASGDVVGTIMYASPEYLEERVLSEQADIYAVGTIAYTLITGQKPFSSRNIISLIEEKISSVPIEPCLINPRCPLELSSLIMKALEYDPDRRFESAEEMEEALSCFEEDYAGNDAFYVRPNVLVPDEQATIATELYPIDSRNGIGSSSFFKDLFSLRPRDTLSGSRRVSPHQAANLGWIAVSGIILGMLLFFVEPIDPGDILKLHRWDRTQSVIEVESPAVETAEVLEAEIVEQGERVEPPAMKVADLVPREPVSVPQERVEVDTTTVEKELSPKKARKEIPAATEQKISKPDKPAIALSRKSSESTRPQTVVSSSKQPEAARVVVPELKLSMAYKVRATLLYRFPDYIKWPASAFNSSRDAVNICIWGKDPFGAYLDRNAAQSGANTGRKSVIRRLPAASSLAAMSGCQVVYAARSLGTLSTEVRAEILKKNILLVTDNTGDGIVDFMLRKRKVKFAIDLRAAKEAGLEIGKLLTDLAVKVIK